MALTLSGTFDTKDAGTGKAVTSTSALTGAQAANYTLTQPAGLTGTITPAPLTVTADNQSKTYGQTWPLAAAPRNSPAAACKMAKRSVR